MSEKKLVWLRERKEIPLKVINISKTSDKDIKLYESKSFVLSKTDTDEVILEGEVAEFGTVDDHSENENERWYSKEPYMEEVDRLQPLITDSRLFGALDHDDDYAVKMKEVSHMITMLYFCEERQRVIIRIKLIPTIIGGGSDAIAIVKAGGKLSISARAIGYYDEDTHEATMDTIFTYDIVDTPGMVFATLNFVEASNGVMYHEINEKDTSLVKKLLTQKNIIKLNENKMTKLDENEDLFEIPVVKDGVEASVVFDYNEEAEETPIVLVKVIQGDDNIDASTMSGKDFLDYAELVEMGLMTSDLFESKKSGKKPSTIKQKLFEAKKRYQKRVKLNEATMDGSEILYTIEDLDVVKKRFESGDQIYGFVDSNGRWAEIIKIEDFNKYTGFMGSDRTSSGDKIKLNESADPKPFESKEEAQSVMDELINQVDYDTDDSLSDEENDDARSDVAYREFENKYGVGFEDSYGLNESKKIAINEAKKTKLNENLLADVTSALSPDMLELLQGAIGATGMIMSSVGITKGIDYLKQQGNDKVKDIIKSLEKVAGFAGDTAQNRNLNEDGSGSKKTVIKFSNYDDYYFGTTCLRRRGITVNDDVDEASFNNGGGIINAENTDAESVTSILDGAGMKNFEVVKTDGSLDENSDLDSFSIEVSAKDAMEANAILKDARNLNFENDGSTIFLFENEDDFNEAIELLGDLEITGSSNPSNLNEAKGVEFPNSNMMFNGVGMDSNGNKVAKIGFPNDRGFTIQTNGNLPVCDKLTKDTKPEDIDLGAIENEVLKYVEEFGTNAQKSKLKKYGSMNENKKSKMNENEDYKEFTSADMETLTKAFNEGQLVEGVAEDGKNVEIESIDDLKNFSKFLVKFEDLGEAKRKLFENKDMKKRKNKLFESAELDKHQENMDAILSKHAKLKFGEDFDIFDGANMDKVYSDGAILDDAYGEFEKTYGVDFDGLWESFDPSKFSGKGAGNMNESLELKPNASYLVKKGDMEAYCEFKKSENGINYFDNSGETIEIADEDLEKSVSLDEKKKLNENENGDQNPDVESLIAEYAGMQDTQKESVRRVYKILLGDGREHDDIMAEMRKNLEKSWMNESFDPSQFSGAGKGNMNESTVELLPSQDELIDSVEFAMADIAEKVGAKLEAVVISINESRKLKKGNRAKVFGERVVILNESKNDVFKVEYPDGNVEDVKSEDVEPLVDSTVQSLDVKPIFDDMKDDAIEAMRNEQYTPEAIVVQVADLKESVKRVIRQNCRKLCESFDEAKKLSDEIIGEVGLSDGDFSITGDVAVPTTKDIVDEVNGLKAMVTQLLEANKILAEENAKLVASSGSVVENATTKLDEMSKNFGKMSEDVETMKPFIVNQAVKENSVDSAIENFIVDKIEKLKVSKPFLSCLSDAQIEVWLNHPDPTSKEEIEKQLASYDGAVSIDDIVSLAGMIDEDLAMDLQLA
jgi:hypothetical protein